MFLMNNSLKTEDKNWSDKTILIVEDDIACKLLYREILSSTGIQVIFHSSGRRAIKYVSLLKDTVDIIVMDIKLPDISGFETAKRIRLIDKEIPIIMVSAYSVNTIDKNKHMSENSEYLEKPIRIEEFISVLDKHLNSKKEISKNSFYNKI